VTACAGVARGGGIWNNTRCSDRPSQLTFDHSSRPANVLRGSRGITVQGRRPLHDTPVRDHEHCRRPQRAGPVFWLRRGLAGARPARAGSGRRGWTRSCVRGATGCRPHDRRRVGPTPHHSRPGGRRAAGPRRVRAGRRTSQAADGDSALLGATAKPAESRPGFAIARQWAGLEQEAEMLRKEIARLRSPVSRAAYDLEHAGAHSTAQRLLRALEGR
jgi:hypothetical protein